MIGTIALRAWAESSDPIPGHDFEALLNLIHEGEVYHETGDIDALASRLGLDQRGACILLQFKYSQCPEKYPITPGDLADICECFLRSTRQPMYREFLITGYRVMTNRPISPTLLPVIDMPKGKRDHPQFDTPELKALLQEIQIIPDLDFSTWMNALKHFASEYGVEPEEFDRGIHQLIGELVSRTST